MCCTRLAGNTGRKNNAENRHLHTIAQLCWAESLQLRHLSTIGKKTCKTSICPTCPHNMANFGPLAAEIGSGVWGTPANFNRLHVLASLLQRHCSSEANQTLHNIWRSPGLLQYVNILAVCPWWNFAKCKIHFASKSCILLYLQGYCTALEQWPSAKLCSMVQGMELRNFPRGRHLQGGPKKLAPFFCMP